MKSWNISSGTENGFQEISFFTYFWISFFWWCDWWCEFPLIARYTFNKHDKNCIFKVSFQFLRKYPNEIRKNQSNSQRSFTWILEVSFYWPLSWWDSIYTWNSFGSTYLQDTSIGDPAGQSTTADRPSCSITGSRKFMKHTNWLSPTKENSFW